MPVDYLSGLGVLPDPMGAINKQIAFKTGIDAQKVETLFKTAQIGAQAERLQRMTQYQSAMQSYLANPTAQGLASLMGAFPEFSDESKAAFNALDQDRRTSDLTQVGEVATLAKNGNWDGAAQAMKRRIDADQAAGHVDPEDQRIYDMIISGDPAQRKAALGMISYGIAVAVGPEHAKSFLEVGGLSQEPNLKSESGIVYDGNTGNVIGQLPGSDVKVIPGVGVTRVGIDGVPMLGSGGTQSAPSGEYYSQGGSPPVNGAPQQAVASTFSAAGFPGPVVAGFLGNFHVEGGYDGAQGDGGSAHGIAQLRGSRLENFKRMFGKLPGEASPQEQARFTVWEMQNPEAAGMTVGQRDAILRAKTPAEAASLIDRYYERSSGEHRQKRMAAAEQFGGVQIQATAQAGGKTFYKVNGKWFDNPEGK